MSKGFPVRNHDRQGEARRDTGTSAGGLGSDFLLLYVVLLRSTLLLANIRGASGGLTAVSFWANPVGRGFCLASAKRIKNGKI